MTGIIYGPPYLFPIHSSSTYPILFNPLKHHLAALQDILLQAAPEAFPTQLLVLGNSQMDMYHGPLSVATIFQEIMTGLHGAGIASQADFEAWLAGKGGYADMILSDGATWILRLAANQSAYIHLHPGRYSRHTTRIKATALKTVLAYRMKQQWQQLPVGSLREQINEIRQQLALSPLRSLAESEHLRRVMVIVGVRLSEEI
ncbi:hypothetical protein [Chitinophaga nivalis]|uniref:Uncharacterized protein n=1 Tax=Chitinophaga nivalis TaxID=2991709 RepID=A0ABT3IPV6_9BACT|nr:hypothetical protein [Chitinophaga nivalis]MCW3464319.1 hypothetical protein [Chitinophaga nivalis]MCW3485990.1 hypothetical protein [Chitinophaga nivalis]